MFQFNILEFSFINFFSLSLQFDDSFFQQKQGMKENRGYALRFFVLLLVLFELFSTSLRR